MRLVELLVPDDRRSAVLQTLDETNVDYVVTEETSDRTASIVSLPLPNGAVDEILGELRDAGLDEQRYTVISELESATTPNIGDLEAKYTEAPGNTKISHTELRTTVQGLLSDTPTFVALTILSAMVASAGLLLNSAIVIVGAMVISPFVGAALAASVGVVIDDREMVIESLGYQAGGLVLAIISAAGISILFQQFYLVPPGLSVDLIDQISSFGTPAVLTVAIAFFAGAAGALTLASDLSTAIAGVAVAAALVPAASVVGIAIVWGQPALALGALVLLAANVLFINLTAYTVFRVLGYNPAVIGSFRQDIQFDTHTVGYALVIGVVVFLIIVTAIGVFQYIQFQQTVNYHVEQVLEEPPYEQFRIVDIQTSYGGIYWLDQPVAVTVTLAHPTRVQSPQLAPLLQQRIAENTEWAVLVKVQFLDYQVAAPQPTKPSEPADSSRPPTAL